jgi:hypothetical protein
MHNYRMSTEKLESRIMQDFGEIASINAGLEIEDNASDVEAAIQHRGLLVANLTKVCLDKTVMVKEINSEYENSGEHPITRWTVRNQMQLGSQSIRGDLLTDDQLGELGIRKYRGSNQQYIPGQMVYYRRKVTGKIVGVDAALQSLVIRPELQGITTGGPFGYLWDRYWARVAADEDTPLIDIQERR